jgi:hypothetical protein
MINLGRLQTITELSLHGSSFNSTDLKYLDAHDRLWALDLSAAHVNDAPTLDAIRGFQGSVLDLSDTAFGDRAVQAVQGMNNLAVLLLNNTPLTDEGCASLACTKLATLQLSGTRITDRGLQSLRRMKTLEVLDLSHTSISIEGVRLLLDLPRLGRLYILGTTVSEEALEALRRGCADLQIITKK